MSKLNNRLLLIGRDDEEGPFTIFNSDFAKQCDFLPVSEIESNLDKFHNAYPSIGDIFIKHPMTNQYVINDENVELTIYKLTCDTMMHFAALLNADKVTYSVHILDRKDTKVNVNLSGGAPVGSGKVTVENDKEQQLHKNIGVSYSGEGGNRKLTQEEYERAKEYFNNNPLLKTNLECKTMLDKRDPRFDNQATHFGINISQLSTINSDLNIAAQLKSKGKYINIKSGVGVKKEFEHNVILHFEIAFPQEQTI